MSWARNSLLSQVCIMFWSEACAFFCVGEAFGYPMFVMTLAVNDAIRERVFVCVRERKTKVAGAT